MNRLENIDTFIKKEPWLHILFWLIVLFFPYLKFADKAGGYNISLFHDMVALVCDMIPSYIMYLWFFPLKNKKKYIILIIIMFISIAFLYDYLDGFFHDEPVHTRLSTIISSIIKYISFSLLFFALYSVKEIYRKQVEFDQISRQKKEAELSALKTQINPHFLFNSLNTIYGSALKKEDKTADMILQLSDNFRYLLVEGQEDKVAIHKEIKHLKDYVELQKERLVNKISLEWYEDIDNYEQHVAPLLLLPFVENAFKYTSVLSQKHHKILIKLSLNKKQLFFECSNPYNEQKHTMDVQWQSSGIGLKNVRERLRLLYPKKHELDITTKNGFFHIKLTIQL